MIGGSEKIFFDGIIDADELGLEDGCMVVTENGNGNGNGMTLGLFG